eukprot:366561-Chlamydomonas_euryale.AAC.10
MCMYAHVDTPDNLAMHLRRTTSNTACLPGSQRQRAQAALVRAIAFLREALTASILWRRWCRASPDTARSYLQNMTR